MDKDDLKAKVTEIMESEDVRLAIAYALIDANYDGYQRAMNESMRIHAEVYGTGGQNDDRETSK